jgi:hypothetical protein
VNLKDDDGAVAVIVAIFFSLVALGIGSLAFDGGALWQSQRTMVTHSDAMAHGGAVRMMEALRANEGCLTQGQVADEVAKVRDLNDPSDRILEPVYVRCNPATFSGLVQVQARGDSDRYFAPTDDLTAFGTSAVDFKPRYRPAQGWSVCRNLFHPDNKVNPQKFELAEGVYALPYVKAEDILIQAGLDPCPAPGVPKSANNAPGAWGWLKSECVPSSPSVECQGEVGNDELKVFQGRVGETMYLPIFDSVKGTGNSINPATFRIVGQAKVELLGDCMVPATKTFTDCTPPYVSPGQQFVGMADYLIFRFVEWDLYENLLWSDILYDGFDVAFCDSDTSLTWCS